MIFIEETAVNDLVTWGQADTDEETKARGPQDGKRGLKQWAQETALCPEMALTASQTFKQSGIS